MGNTVPSLAAAAAAKLTARKSIQMLNDRLRTHGAGGRVVMTAGISAMDDGTRQQVVSAIRAFDAFTQDNDPHDEHDCAALEVDDLTVMFRIDYYDLTLSAHSPDPADPVQTVRVLTVMLAEEY